MAKSKQPANGAKAKQTQPSKQSAKKQSEELGYNSRDIRVAAIMDAFSHPARTSIIRIIAKRGSCVCGELVQELPLAQATVSQHLKALKDAGIIKSKEHGPFVRYTLHHRAVLTAQELLTSYMEKVTKSLH